MERWSAIDQENIHLATIRVYERRKPDGTQIKPRIILFLPPEFDNPDEPGDEFELDMVHDQVDNQIVVAEREKEPGTASRARTTILTGSVRHECNLKPLLTEKYRQRIRDRSRPQIHIPGRSRFWITRGRSVEEVQSTGLRVVLRTQEALQTWWYVLCNIFIFLVH